MLKSKTVTKNSWELELEVDTDESHAWIISPCGNFSSSLACADDMGCVTDGDDNEKTIPQYILDWANKTAEAYGY
jgi:hypothetical protein